MIHCCAGVPRLFDLVRVREERVKLAFYFALRDTVVADSLDQASRIAYGQDRRWGRVVTIKVSHSQQTQPQRRLALCCCCHGCAAVSSVVADALASQALWYEQLSPAQFCPLSLPAQTCLTYSILLTSLP